MNKTNGSGGSPFKNISVSGSGINLELSPASQKMQSKLKSITESDLYQLDDKYLMRKNSTLQKSLVTLNNNDSFINKFTNSNASK